MRITINSNGNEIKFSIYHKEKIQEEYLLRATDAGGYSFYSITPGLFRMIKEYSNHKRPLDVWRDVMEYIYHLARKY